MLDKNPNLGWRDVQEILITSANLVDNNDPDWITNGAGFHFNHQYGAGLIDATAAVNLAEEWTNLAEVEIIENSQTEINQAIPDNDSTGISYEIAIEDNLRCEHITLAVSATHTYRGDLRITLTSPSGTESVLAETRNADSDEDYSEWLFSSVRHWGEESSGTWTVNIADGVNVDTGTLTSLSLAINGTPIVTSDGFATWVAEQGVSESLPADDPDNDGLPNLVEYYLGGNASTYDSETSPVLSVEGELATFTFWHAKSANDVTGIVEWSTTLLENSWEAVDTSTEVIVDEPTRELLQTTFPLEANTLFVRLRVE